MSGLEISYINILPLLADTKNPMVRENFESANDS
jgi:hypothetical protein